jgi:hypothetical protein
MSVPRYMVSSLAQGAGLVPQKHGGHPPSTGEGRRQRAEGAVMNFDTESIDGYAIPVDPMDLLQCDSCQ